MRSRVGDRNAGVAKRVVLAGGDVSTHAVSMATGCLRVQVQKLRNDHGHLLAAIYDDPVGFPREGRPARNAKVEIRGGQATATFEGLPPGEYAVAVHHDESGDGKMNVNLLGLPTEGFGLSNFDKLKMTPPSFDQSKFDYPGGEKAIEIKIHYLF
jgi:uncharacterized protein (DUF2141 family)